MSHVIVCDVCEKTFSRKEWADSPGIEAEIPANLLPEDIEPGEFAFCSWECLGSLADSLRPDNEHLTHLPSEVMERILAGEDDEDDDEQIVVPDKPKFAPEQPRLVQTPMAGIRIDGRPLTS